MLSRRFATVVTLVIVVAFVLVAVAPAFAAAPARTSGPARASAPLHAALVGSTPRDGSTVGTAREVVLTFSERVDPTFVNVAVKGPAGSETAGAPTVEGREVAQALTAQLPAGEHLVTYRVVSTDGHPVSGTLTFTTTTEPAPSPSPTASATPTTSGWATASTAAPPTTAAAHTAARASPRWGWLLVGLAALVGLLALGLWRRPGGVAPGAEARAATPPRPGDGEAEPHEPGRQGHPGPFA